MLSPNTFGVTGSDAMDAYLTGGVDRPAASGTTTTATTYLHLHQQHSAAQNSHHDELAPQQQYLGQGWEEIRRKRRSCSGRTSRSLGRGSIRKTSASGRLRSRNQQCGKTSSRTTAPTLQQERRKIYLPSRPAEEKENYRPVPPWGKTCTVPSRRGNKYIFTVPSRRENLFRSVLPSRPVEKLCTRCSVPPTFYVFVLPSRCHLVSRQTS